MKDTERLSAVNWKRLLSVLFSLTGELDLNYYHYSDISLLLLRALRSVSPNLKSISDIKNYNKFVVYAANHLSELLYGKYYSIFVLLLWPNILNDILNNVPIEYKLSDTYGHNLVQLEELTKLQIERNEGGEQSQHLMKTLQILTATRQQVKELKDRQNINVHTDATFSSNSRSNRFEYL